MYNILIVDDEPDERNVIRFLLEKFNIPCKIYDAPNGRDALEILGEIPINILITDVKMPYISGIELSKRARLFYPDIYIIFFSGHDNFDFIKSALSVQAVDYLLKPINPEEFEKLMIIVVQRINDGLEHNKTINQIEVEASESVLQAPELSDNHCVSGKLAVLKVKKYIDENYHEDLSLQRLSELVYLSPRYLSSLFTKEIGSGINKYIRTVRMEKARELLINTNKKVNSVCREVGYSKISYFCQCFQEEYGATPGKYRQQFNHQNKYPPLSEA